jgi:hypothetical protein
MKDEWGDKKARGKILTGLGEFLRGAAQRNKYVPFSERMYARAQKQYDSKMKALVGLERAQGLQQRAELSDARIRELAVLTDKQRRDLADADNRLKEMEISRKRKNDVMGYLLGNANVAAKLEEIKRKAKSPANLEQLVAWELQGFFTDNNIPYEEQQAHAKAAADILNESKLKSKHKPRPRLPGAGTRMTTGSNQSYFDRTTGKMRYGQRFTKWNPATNQVEMIDPQTGESVGDTTFTVPEKVANSYRSFNDTVGQSRLSLGQLAAAGANQDRIGGVWDSSMGELARRLEVGGWEKLMPSEVIAKISAKNAELMHASGQIGYRPAMQLVESLAHEVEQKPFGTIRSKIVAMAGFTVATEYAQRRMLVEADPLGGDTAHWDVTNPAVAQKIRDAILQYTDAVLSGRQATMPTFEQIIGLPPTAQGGPGPAAPSDISNEELLRRFQELPPMALPQ